MVMTTIVAVSAEGGVAPHAFQGSSQQDVFTRGGDAYGHHPHCHELGPRGHRPSPSCFGRRLHRHHHRNLHHLKGSNSLAHRHGHGGLVHRGSKHHRGGPHHGLRGRHAFRGLQDIASHEQRGPHCRQRMHRSLSPHHLMHNRSSDGSPGSPHKGHRGHRGHCRGHRGHCGRGPSDDKVHAISFRELHLHLHGQEPNSGAETDRPSPLPAAIEQGIEQLGQLSLKSESGAL